ncbi:MAG: hypothetical protein HOM68_00075 [Gemmatimonadetes bacterium]|jgi:hypothetical protein|nr:hypothetical protein [Gemmatimonadota bacterium]MBT4610563.1 hypothetical protein [Gemmatimonadota bacterium]MBT5054907.1 hypothetical protein [Gemmatimonadota bacterium]MBT5145828.1 hypothetical protein [Gemmatimonadota bacterium]MBT5587809.1 hypothetical protein [Gemmatimonadota bacterium]
MIERSTALVVGAGAGVAYGFPTGRRLRRDILDRIESLSSAGIVSLEEARAFGAAFRQSGCISIDEFLQSRTDLNELGKFAIATALMPKEVHGNLFNVDLDAEEHWYEYLFQKMSSDFEDFGLNQLGIVTFNYDRSLEQYLHTALCNKFDRSPVEAAKQLEKLNIVHMHGQLGYLDWQREADVASTRDYKADAAKQAALVRASKDIAVIHEEIPEARLKAALSVVHSAETVFFLGFGYGQTNMERLRVREFRSPEQLIGTAYGLTLRERGAISRSVDEKIRTDMMYDCGIVSLFRNHRGLD